MSAVPNKDTLVPKDALKSANDNNLSSEDMVLTELELEWKLKIHDRLLKVMDLSLIGTVDEDRARAEIGEIVQRLFAEDSAPLSLDQRRRIVKEIENEVMGLGPLEPLLADAKIADILVNGPKQVYIEKDGKLQLTDVQFNDDNHLVNIIDRIVSAVGRRIDESSPMVDARLKDGSRVNAIIPPLALDGPVMSIRRFGVDLLKMEDLVGFGALSEEVAKVLRGIVKAKLNVLISGGTGAGKTTMLNVLSGCIPENERIVTIEDSAELQLQQPHVVRLETRPPNIEGNGEVNQRDLVRNSLRMRPDRIVIGEVRGPEALDMLQAMNTGHDGSLTTIHANTPRDALTRVENMVSMTGINFTSKVLREQIASAINVVIQLSRHEDGRRRLVSLQEINGMEGEMITMSELFRFDREGVDEDGNVQGGLKPTGIVPGFYKTITARGIDMPIEVFHPDGQW
jgi:pilus assembly protein CpaF